MRIRKVVQLIRLIRTHISLLRELALFQCLKFAFMRPAGPLLLVYRGSRVKINKSAQLTGGGVLHIGKRWSAGHFFRSELILASGARAHVTGSFQVYTGSCITVNNNAELILHSGYINCRTIVDCYDRIEFGDSVAIAKECVFRDSDSHEIEQGKPVSAPIIIGNRVWIGTRAIVLKGVTIGEGSVVAAGAVVVHDVKQCSLVGGVPARALRENVQWR